MAPFSISEIQAAAKDKLPKYVYDFYASGSDDEKALARNRSSFDRYVYRNGSKKKRKEKKKYLSSTAV